MRIITREKYMAKAFAKKFYSTSVWRECRNAYAASRGHLCERCISRGILSYGEIVHHKIELTPENINDPDITLNWDNLQLLCRLCHAEVQDARKNCRRFTIGPGGEIIISTPPVDNKICDAP